MSKRPNIQSRHEKAAEREIQRARHERDRAMRAEMKKSQPTGIKAEPVVLSETRGPVQHEIPAGAQEWIDAEAAEQLKHYKRIFREIERLAPLRDEWVEEFFERISGPRGFSVHAGQRRTIPKKDIPKRPDRPWRLVW